MVRIGNIDLQGELNEIPLDKLVEDVPVNDEHVRELMENLKVLGQVSPLVVWSQDFRIIDGFHRVRAMKLIGTKTATGIIFDCSEDDFWNIRILNAVSHKTVHFSRVVEWVQQAFNRTKWGETMRAQEAFRIGRRGSTVRLPLTPQERFELTAWVKEKSKLWSLSPNKISEMLKIANIADPLLVSQVRDEPKPGTLTPGMLGTIATNLPRHDLQQAVVQKVQEEKLPHRDTQILVEQVAQAPTEEAREKLLQVPYKRKEKGRPPKHAVEELKGIRSKIILESLQQLLLILPELSRPQDFDPKVPEVIGILSMYLGTEETEALSILQRENRSLKEKVQEMTREIERKDSLIDTQRRNTEGMQQRIDSLMEELKKSR